VGRGPATGRESATGGARLRDSRTSGPAVERHEPGEGTQPGPRDARRVRAWPFVSRLVARSISEFLDDLGTHLAASIAYRALFSLVPLAIFLTAVVSLVLGAVGQKADIVDAIVRNIPLDEQGQKTLRDILEGATSNATTVGLIGLVVLLWAASGMMGAIRLALNQAWDIEQRRPFVRGKAIDVMLVLGAALLILASFAVSVGARIVERYAPEILGGWAGALVSSLPPLVLAFAAVLFLYLVVPAQRPAPRDVWRAALLVAVVFVAMQSLFGVYVQHFASYNAIYGSLGAVFGFLIFVYAASIVFLLGAEIASEWPRVRSELAHGNPDDRAGEDGPPLTERILDALRGLVVRR
jgi:membrane protein